jgi:hypothetical protein
MFYCCCRCACRHVARKQVPKLRSHYQLRGPTALRNALLPTMMSDSAVSDVVWRQGYYEKLGGRLYCNQDHSS